MSGKDWPRTLETIKEYLTSQYGETGATLESVVQLVLPSGWKLRDL
jgi:hypothetical protein